MRTVVQDKYFLRDLHREIDLFDRKLHHMVTNEVFASDADRDLAVRKASTKRETLVLQARTLAASGIEFNELELPRSLRPEGWQAFSSDAEASPAQLADAVGVIAKTAPTSAFGQSVARLQKERTEEESPLATALGPWQNDLAAYKKRRQKTATATV